MNLTGQRFEDRDGLGLCPPACVGVHGDDLRSRVWVKASVYLRSESAGRCDAGELSRAGEVISQDNDHDRDSPTRPAV